MKTSVLKLLQTALNYTISLDPESVHKFRLLHNKVFCIRLMPMDFSFFMLFKNNKITLQDRDDRVVDASITGTPLGLLQMRLSPHDRQKFFSEDVILTGDMELAKNVNALFDDLHIDCEELLSQWVGDIPATHLGNVARSIRHLGQKAQNTLEQNLNELIHEELAYCPPQEALQDFYHDVDKLRMDTDRLDTKFNLLKQAFDKKKG